MQTLTNPEIIAKVSSMIPDLTGVSYILVMENNGIKIHPRINQPCYGEMRDWKNSIPREKPGDLRSPFPDGVPIGFGFKWYSSPEEKYKAWITSKDSPYRELFKDFIPVKNNENQIGFIITNTKVDSDLLVHFCIFNKSYSNSKAWLRLVEDGVDPSIAFIATTQASLYQKDTYRTKETWSSSAYNIFGYVLPNKLDFKAIYSGRPNYLAKDYLFYNRAPYHRNSIGNLNDIWLGKDSVRSQFNLSHKEFIDQIIPKIKDLL